MERLTFKDKDCVHYEERQDIKVTNSQLLDKLGEYEDLEERLQAVYGECGGLLEKVVEHLERHVEIDFPDPVFKARLLTDDEVDRWREYKKLDEQGKLLKLPCAVGDTVWFIKSNFSYMQNPKAEKIRKVEIIDGEIIFRTENRCFEMKYIGKIVFLTQEEAEAALKEL